MFPPSDLQTFVFGFARTESRISIPTPAPQACQITVVVRLDIKKDSSLRAVRDLGLTGSCRKTSVAYLRTISINSFFQRSSAFSYCSVVKPFSGYQRLKP